MTTLDAQKSKARPIRWLHLSDLHMGCKGKEFWETVEEAFFRDIAQQLERVGAPDLLLFTGDLAFSGQPKEFDAVDQFLDSLYRRLAELGVEDPLLLAVPGNHDVVRPKEPHDQRAFHILHSFDGTTDDAVVADLYKELWKDRDASFIEPLFPGYIPWFNRRIRPALERRSTVHAHHFSAFPSDFMVEVEPEGAFRLGILGLNSTWLQYTGGDFNGKLLIPREQYRAAIAPNAVKPSEVFGRNTHTLLLMHHPPNWLCKNGREIFDEQIYDPHHVTACLYGHMHKANGTMFQSGGGEPRVFLQSPSLFGVEHWGTSKEDRAFGYSWGQLSQGGELRIWPRKLSRKQDRIWGFDHDTELHETPEGGVILRPGPGGQGTVAVEQRGVDLNRYLNDVLEKTSTLEIKGIVMEDPSAVCPAIENLYTPLRTRSLGRLPSGDASTEALAEDMMRGDGTEELSEVLRRGDRLLIEGAPGGGKTTFLRFVACMLARDGMGQPCPGHRSWRSHYLGLDTDSATTPVFLRLAGLVSLLTDGTDKPDDRGRLLDLLASDLRASSLSSAVDREYWEKLFEDGNAWLLLDGLDEIDRLDLRSRVFAVVSDAIQHWKAPMVVASRPFQTEQMRLMGFQVSMVEPFDSASISSFLTYWSAALHRQDPTLALRGKAANYQGLLETAILSRPRIRALARNPVMLTCLCVVHWNRGDLPEVRSRVYAAAISWLLRARGARREERFGLSVDFAERALSLLALSGMRSSQGKQPILSVADAVDTVLPAFARQFPETSEEALRTVAREWVLSECEGSGVIEELPDDRMRFWHLTFQEYLAASRLARSNREVWWDAVREKFSSSQWRETTELFVTCLYDRGEAEDLDWLLNQLLDAAESSLAGQARVVGILGRLLQPLERCDYKPNESLRSKYSAALESAMAIFRPEGAAEVPVEDRIAAAEALGQGGDPRLRPECMESNFLETPGVNWRLGKYPVTVEEYQRFVDARGYEERRWWSSDGWSQKEAGVWESPGHWEDQLLTPNRPVIYVSWWESEAYCGWLSEQRNCVIRLPMQAEWEAVGIHSKGEYPWGSEGPNAELASFDKTSGNGASPVGIFPKGNGQYGHCDLGGNVWEWCLDEIDEGENRPVRGSCWVGPARGLRSANRGGHGPRHRFDGVGFRVLCLPPEHAVSRG